MELAPCRSFEGALVAVPARRSDSGGRVEAGRRNWTQVEPWAHRTSEAGVGALALTARGRSEVGPNRSRVGPE